MTRSTISRRSLSRLGSLFAIGAFAFGCHGSTPVRTSLVRAEAGLPHLVATRIAHEETKPVTPIKELSATERAAKKSELAAARAKHLDMLHAYWQAGVFPKNTDKPIVANVFRDASGHLCAVANMVDKDGLHDVVDATARTDNFVRVADQSSGPLADWALTSGFTREEIAMIQVPYMPAPKPVAVAPHVSQAALAEAKERTRLMSHLAEVERRLRDDTDQSLEIALARIAPAAKADQRLGSL